MAQARTETLAERFQIADCLGEGASGVVYRAFDTSRNMEVAVKLLTRLDPGALFRFKGEFRNLANIAHHHLLSLYDLVAHENTWLLSMELIEGTDFLTYVRPLTEGGAHNDNAAHSGNAPPVPSFDTFRTATIHGSSPDTALKRVSLPTDADERALGSLDVGRLRRALLALCEGLAALHKTHRLHRDLKPANVLVTTADERVVVCDFGLVVEGTQAARPVGSADLSAPFATFGTDGKVVGTLAYMPPEQALGQSLSEASDWYAVGAMLYHALTGSLPFAIAPSFLETVRLRVEMSPRDPREFQANLPEDLVSLALALLRPNASERPTYADIRARLGVAAEANSEHTGPVARDSAARLIGRTLQFEQLHAAFAEIENGRAAVAFVAGRSGMGKTALVRTFLAELEQKHGATVLHGRCYEREDIPYKAVDPWVDALSSYLLRLSDQDVEALLPEGISALLPLFPALERVPAVGVAMLHTDARLPIDAVERRKWAFRALRELLRRVARKTPLVICVDDLQWGDEDSGPLFAELLRAPAPPSLLVVFCHRSEDEAQTALLSALRTVILPASGIAMPVEVAVGPLSAADSLSLAQSLLSGHAQGAQFAARIAAEADGSPFFVRELCSYLRAAQQVDENALNLGMVLRARLAALPAESRHLLALIAAAGRPERRDVLQRAAALSHDFEAERVLVLANLVQSNGTAPDDRIEPYHDRIREAALGGLSPESTVAVHRALAGALAEFGANDPEHMLRHHRAAGDRLAAYECALLAAEHAERALAFERAARLLRDALGFGVAEGEAKRLLAERLGMALMFCGRGPEAATALFEAVAGATPDRAVALRSLGITQLFRAGLISQAYTEITRAEHVVGMPAPRSTGRALLMLLWRRLRITLRGLTPKALGKRVPSAAEIQRMDLLWGIGAALSPIDQLRGGVYQAEHMLMALKSGDTYRFARALAIESTVHGTSNTQPQKTQWVIDRGLEFGGASGEPHALSAVKGTSGVVRMLEGRFREAVRLTREAQNIIRERLNSTLAWDWVIMVLFDLRTTALLGHVQELSTRVPEFVREADARGDLYAAVSARTSHCCYAWLGPDQPELAQREAEFADAHWKHEGYHLQNWYVTQALGEIALYRDDVDAAYARLAGEWKAMFIIRKKIQFSRAEILYLRARLALAKAVKNERDAMLREARADARALGRENAPWIRAHGRLIEACVLAFHDGRAAVSVLREVEGQFEAVDMLLASAVARLRRGQLTEGEVGAALVAEACASLRQLGATRPAYFARVIAPGFPAVEHDCA